jgi:hypothetical protein
MRKIVKHPNSIVISEKLTYIEGNSFNNSKISKVLFNEQKGFCAYTEEYIGRADAKEIEHFNPTLKGGNEDGYYNWFLVKHQWNNEKSSKWFKFQPILNPCDDDFETRIVYDDGDYRVAQSTDIEAINLINLLNLADPILADERKRYIKRKKDEIQKFGVDASNFFEILIADNVKQISYLRAIQEEFNIDIWSMIPSIE